MAFTIDVDTGGTFTDGFATDGETVRICKVETTPHDLAVCFVECLESLAQSLDLTVKDLLRRTLAVRYSTTVGTNALIQRTGPRLGLMSSLGAEPGVRDHPLVDPTLVATLDEEVDAKGRVVRPLQQQAVRTALEGLLDVGAQVVAVALRNSDVNPCHERLVKAVVASEYPVHYLGAVPVFAASDVAIRPGGRERMNAAVLTAFLHDQIATHLYRAEDFLRGHGYRRGMLVVHNNGGVCRVVTSTALSTYNSGPVAGLFGACRTAQSMGGHEVVVTMDIGGTSLDVGVIRAGAPPLSSRAIIHGMEVNLPIVQVDTFGIGGGSIARVADDGQIAVGPQSAGSLPGPAAYDLGGEHPTVTDADLILGRLSPEMFLGGRRALNIERAREVLGATIARRLGIPVEDAALRIVEAVETQIVQVLQSELDQLGVSPTQVTLLAFGGGSGVRCAEVGRALGVRSVMTSAVGSVFCAFGASTLDLVHRYEAIDDDAGAEGVRERLRRRALHDLMVEGFPASAARWDYEEERQPRGLQRLLVSCPVPHYLPKPAEDSPGDGSRARAGERAVRWGEGVLATPVYVRDRLRAGDVLRGPAAVESGDTTVVVPPGMRFHLDAYRNGILARLDGDV